MRPASLFIDSCGEMARLFFSKDMGKSSSSMEQIRAINNYPGATERMNMLIRRLKGLRDRGTEVFFTAHEDIQQVYAKGGAITPKGKAAEEPVGVKGWPDMPGKRTPDEMCRAADNVFRIRYLNGAPTFVTHREPLASSTDFWEVKDRFNAPALKAGYLPMDYREIVKIVGPTGLWAPPYIWILYGAFGVGKTRFALTVPRPIVLLDLDRGTKSIEHEVAEIRKKEGDASFIVHSYDVEEAKEYERFLRHVNECFS